MKISERIRQARRKAKLSQAQLAQQINVQRSAVANWESASEVCPTMNNMIAIACICGISLEWLGTGRGQMRLNDIFQDEVLAVDADIVELPNERELLACFRSLPPRSQLLVLELTQSLRHQRSRQR